MILTDLKKQADYLVLDAGAAFCPVNLTALMHSDRIVTVTSTDDLALEMLQQTVKALQQIQLHATPVDLVMVNRARAATVISKTEAEGRLNTKFVAFIIPAPEMCFQANRNHMPLILSQPGNLTAVQMRELAEHLLG